MRHLGPHQRLPLGARHDGVRLRADQAAGVPVHQFRRRADQDGRVHQQRRVVALRHAGRRRPALRGPRRRQVLPPGQDNHLCDADGQHHPGRHERRRRHLVPAGVRPVWPVRCRQRCKYDYFGCVCVCAVADCVAAIRPTTTARQSPTCGRRAPAARRMS